MRFGKANIVNQLRTLEKGIADRQNFNTQSGYHQDEPIMVYVSNVSEADALLNICSRILLADLGNKYEYRYLTRDNDDDFLGAYFGWKYIVPAPIKKPTIKRSEIEAAKSLIAKIETGEIEVSDD